MEKDKKVIMVNPREHGVASYLVGRYSGRACPEIIVLHENDNGDYLITHHGIGMKPNYKREFKTFGMYKINKKQASVILAEPKYIERTSRSASNALLAIYREKNLMKEPLKGRAKILRDRFIKNDAKIAKSVFKTYFNDLKKKDKENSKALKESVKADEDRKTKEANKNFLDIFSKFKSKTK